jgi:NAD(P)-dependent dehydrogenase (short-subunit alcohol dehydrogenase family)
MTPPARPQRQARPEALKEARARPRLPIGIAAPQLKRVITTKLDGKEDAMRLSSTGRRVLEVVLKGGNRVADRLLSRGRSEAFSFRDRVVLLTGGSRGLGLVMARALIEEGAAVALLARDAEELERAAADLRARKTAARVLVIPGDVGDRAVAEAAVRTTVERFGRLDVLINNAGVIQTGPFEHMQLRDFEQALAIHFWGPLYTTLAAIPHLKARVAEKAQEPGARSRIKDKHGPRIVNISSIGGKLPVPHLLPYCASKFALAGLSGGLRAELERHGITVTTVCPGLMRTGSHLNAQFKGQHALEFFWFALSDSLPLITVTAEEAAEQILTACRRGQAELVIGLPYRLASRLAPLFPELVAKGLALFSRLMPGPTGPEGDELRPGWASSALTPSVLTVLADRAAAANNELRGRESDAQKKDPKSEAGSERSPRRNGRRPQA